MIDNANLNDLPLVEVPLELRGLSDEEILVLSESRVKEGFIRGFRPSKKERAKRRNEASRKRLLEVEAKMQRECKQGSIMERIYRVIRFTTFWKPFAKVQ